jgi:exosortase A-associated hydrolase 2
LTTRDSEAFFLDSSNGYRFCLLHPGRPPARGSVLFVHAFAEEMNKSRRMAARQARALAQAGFDVLQMDLLGCGDSSGDFSDATWSAWLDDVDLGWEWLAARRSAGLWLWGHRTGCLLACEAARRKGQPIGLILWQPVPSGRLFLNQFLRMKLLGQPDAGDARRADTRSLRSTLAAGAAVEIAGYTLSPGLSSGLDDALLHLPAPGSTVCWLDVAHAADAAPPASSQQVRAWSETGVTVSHQVVVGLPFWQTQEITECDALIERTLEAVCRCALPSARSPWCSLAPRSGCSGS